MDYDARPVLVITAPVQLRALADDVRREIVAILRGGAASTSELARRLNLPKGTVGYHVKVLERAGLIRVVRSRRVRAVTEKFYGRVARLFYLQGEMPPADGGFEGALEDDLTTFGAVQARVLEADAEHFARSLQELLREFGRAESRTGTMFTLVAALYAADDA